MIGLVLLASLAACQSNFANGYQKQVKEISFYLEFVDKESNGVSRKILKEVTRILTTQNYVLSREGQITPTSRFKNITWDDVDTLQPQIHKFYMLETSGANNRPISSSVKVRLTYHPRKNSDTHKISVDLFCKEHRPEWWQCGDGGEHRLPPADKVSARSQTYTDEEVAEHIAQLILDISYKRQ
jgi:predicted small lipoprotein YifL